MTYLTTEFANVSLDLVGPGGFADVAALVTTGLRAEAEINGALRTLQAHEDRFIIAATGGFAEETFA